MVSTSRGVFGAAVEGLLSDLGDLRASKHGSALQSTLSSKRRDKPARLRRSDRLTTGFRHMNQKRERIKNLS
jgi:hypothetical protein